MNDLTVQLCAIRKEHEESPALLPPKQFEPWINKAESHLKRLKQQIKTCPEQDRERITDEHECIVSVLDDILKLRADLIWDLAKDGAGNVDLMTQHEADIYTELTGLAEDLRGVSS